MVQYSAVCVFNEEMDQVVLVHKLRPSWQLNKYLDVPFKADTASKRTSMNRIDRHLQERTCSDSASRDSSFWR